MENVLLKYKRIHVRVFRVRANSSLFTHEACVQSLTKKKKNKNA